MSLFGVMATAIIPWNVKYMNVKYMKNMYQKNFGLSSRSLSRYI